MRASRVIVPLLVACAVTAVIGACASPYGETAESLDAAEDRATVDSGCAEPCPCTNDLECKDPARPRCVSNICVECTRAPDTCSAGYYCNDLSQCTLGCKQESDCQISPTAPHCQTARHQCVECTTNAHCTGGKTCSPSGVCVEACNPPAAPCATGTCCDGLCLDTTADLLNCGGCGTACATTNGTPSCMGGSCFWTCASGFAHCSSGNTGCETNTRSDPQHCGSCTKKCINLNANNVTCSAGACTFTTCLPGYGNCDLDKANGCECECGQSNDACCPGNVCNPGLVCNAGSQKCQ